MKKVSRQQHNRERTLGSDEGLRVPKRAPEKRSEWKRELRQEMTRGGKAE